MKKSKIAMTMAAALIGLAAATSAGAQEITVRGVQDRVVGRTNYGADVVEHGASVVVSLRDLDLGTTAGWGSMETRLSSASRMACNAIEDSNPIDIRPDGGDCARTAYRAAVERVRQLTRASVRVASLRVGVSTGTD